MSIPFFHILAADQSGGLIYAFENCTLPGKLVLLSLFVASLISWTVMWTKFRQMRRAQKRRVEFLKVFRTDRKPLSLYKTQARFKGTPLFNVYQDACVELCIQMLDSPEVDETFEARLELAEPISPAQMGVVKSTMERSVGESALALESRMVLLSTVVSGAPFLGLLGTVWGVMETFGDVAQAGKPNLTAMAPGVSAALITTVTGLVVAIPAMFGHNYLVSTLRGMVVELELFASELASFIEHRYVAIHPNRKEPEE
jgi:biopolymer transport protein ExbB/TolQ